jgi:uncharacterized protein with GYD domain
VPAHPEGAISGHVGPERPRVEERGEKVEADRRIRHAISLSARKTSRLKKKGRPSMARYITLINFTDQGIKTIKDWDKRMTATKERLERAGGKLVDVYLTLGEFDAIAITEAPNDEVALRGAIEYGMAGNGRSRTLRAFTAEETLRIVKQIG